MAVRPILLDPDLILPDLAQPVSVDDPALLGLIQDMLDTLEASPGVALPAPQLKSLRYVIVVEVTRKKARPATRSWHC